MLKDGHTRGAQTESPCPKAQVCKICGSVSPRVSQVLRWFLVYTLLPCLMSQPRVVDASGTPVPNSPMQLPSSNFGSLAPTLMAWAPAPEVPWMRSSMPFFQNLYISKHRSRKFLLSRHGCPVWIHISRKTLGDFATRLAAIEQNFSTFSARLCKVQTNAASASNISGSARSWRSIEEVDGSPAAGSHGPGSSSNNRNTRRRLDTSSNPDDENARNAILLRFPCEQYNKGFTKWINNNLCEESNMPADSRLVTIHCKTGCMSVRLVFETRAKCQDFVARKKDDGFPYEIDSPFFCSVKTTIAVRQSRSIEDREIGKQFAPFWRELADQLKLLFLDGEDEGAFIVPALDTRSKLSIKDRRNEGWKTGVQTCFCWKRTNIYLCCT